MTTVLIVGAGFSLGANGSIEPNDRPYSEGYPLVGQLAAACFDSKYDLSAGVEAAFEEASQRRDHEPVKRLIDLIESADYYAGSAIARADTSPYHALIDRFPDASFLSFNYDGLVELLLHGRRLWTPVDGFGIPCRADVDRSYIAAPPPPTTSTIRVLHLHGSVYLYPIEFEFYDPPGRRRSEINWIRETAKEEVQFDPDSLANCFIPFSGGAQGRPTYKFPNERIIVPSPDKATALQDRFSQAVYQSATSSLQAAKHCVAIGYRFAECDSASFVPLLRAARRSSIESFGLVAPDARDLVPRIRPHLPEMRLSLFQGTFAEWVAADFAYSSA